MPKNSNSSTEERNVSSINFPFYSERKEWMDKCGGQRVHSLRFDTRSRVKREEIRVAKKLFMNAADDF